jgi:hypothetical protein
MSFLTLQNMPLRVKKQILLAVRFKQLSGMLRFIYLFYCVFILPFTVTSHVLSCHVMSSVLISFCFMPLGHLVHFL